MAGRTKKTIETIIFILLALLTTLLWYEEINGRTPQPTASKKVFVPMASKESSAPTEKLSPAVAGDYHTVTRVVDGDTIVIDTGEKVRYIGMDTPETVHPRKSVQCFGHEASEFNKNLVSGKKVRLEKDVSEVDRYGRLLRYVYLEDGAFVNLELVKKGYAQVETFPPDVKYADIFVEAARLAREEKKGLWGECR